MVNVTRSSEFLDWVDKNITSKRIIITNICFAVINILYQKVTYWDGGEFAEGSFNTPFTLSWYYVGFIQMHLILLVLCLFAIRFPLFVRSDSSKKSKADSKTNININISNSIINKSKVGIIEDDSSSEE